MQKIPYIIQMPYNLAQKWDNSVKLSGLLVTHDGGKLSRVGELSLAQRLHGR